MPFLFTKLAVYQKSIKIAEEIGSITESFPRGTYYIADQLNRASLSISLNIAEGNGRYHTKDRQNFFRIARGSAYECIPALQIAKSKSLIAADVYNKLEQNLDEICKMLSGLINKQS